MGKTQSKNEYGNWKVATERERTAFGRKTNVYVHLPGEEPIQIGTGTDGKRLARTLAATLSAAHATSYDVLPPGFTEGEYPTKYGDDVEEWQEWSADVDVIPARVAGAGKAAIAGWLKVVHREREGWIANRLGVSEQTIRQYLSDLREGRR